MISTTDTSAAVTRRRRSLRLRLTAVYTLLVLACGTLLLGITYVLVEHATGRSISYTSRDGRYTITLFKQDGDSAGTGPSDVRTIRPSPGGSQSQSQLGDLPGADPKKSGSDTGVTPPPPDENELRALALEQHASTMHQLLLQGGLALALATLASAAIGWYLAGRTLRPVRAMTATARDISATNLHRRLALSGPPDELTELGDTFDALLDRLESAFDAQRQFVANASHELRTPLARQRTIGQVALADPDATVDSLRGAHEKILQAGRDQEQLIEALLDLARGQSELQRRSPVDLTSVVRRAVEARRDDARDLAVTTSFEPAITLGDSRLIERLVGNLLDNAVRHNVAGGRIEVRTEQDADSAVLVVDNTGAEVDDRDVAAFLEPFRRGVADRTARDKGLGLGLPIVQAIASVHGATLDISPRPGGGVDVRVAFPLST